MANTLHNKELSYLSGKKDIIHFYLHLIMHTSSGNVGQSIKEIWALCFNTNK